MQKGLRVCSIERGSTLDGTGLRYVIFATSCPFRCKFCHNPESWAIPNSFPFMTTDELVANVARLAPFLKLSKGGVTVSGGEPTLHKEFLIDFFTKLKAMGIHTALDTCGHVSINDELKQVIDLTDLFLLDIKNIYEDEHIALTGKSKRKTLDFLTYISSQKKNIIIRIVMYSAQVNSVEYAEKLALYLYKFKEQIEFIELLPYHDMGSQKWKELRIHYDSSIFETPSMEQVKAFSKVLQENGFKTKY